MQYEPYNQPFVRTHLNKYFLNNFYKLRKLKVSNKTFTFSKSSKPLSTYLIQTYEYLQSYHL